jgi:hypothetical protein
MLDGHEWMVSLDVQFTNLTSPSEPPIAISGSDVFGENATQCTRTPSAVTAAS